MTKANTAHAVIRHWAEKTPERIFLTQPHNGEVQEWTFAQAYDAASRLAQWFVDHGYETGDRVALLSKNCAEWIITDLGLQMAGLVLVPIYPTASSETIRYVIEHSGAKAFISGRLDNPGVLDSVFSDALTTISMRYDSVSCEHSWQAMIDSSSPIEHPYDPDEEETMTILYTSGSTGRPKGVVISYRAYAYASSTCTDIYGITPDDRLMSYLPLAHVAERTASTGPVLYGGGTFFFADSLETFVDDLNRAKPTLFTSVPR
ncbi:MAG: AMP-binding protein, partial [Pseudomonadota bacterium]